MFRNLLFRILALIRRNITPVFVSEGEPPELKYETIRKRLQSHNRNNVQTNENNFTLRRHNSLKRTKFDRMLNECKELIHLMGLICLDSDGEAEASCAALNERGIVDGVVTDDNDAFLYGAEIVYRNFNLDGENPMLEKYEIGRIRQKLNIDREKLIALALFLGCDFCPKGVPGVGKERAFKLAQCYENSECSLLERMEKWKREMCTECDKYIRDKILQMEDFPNKMVIDEYKRVRTVKLDKTRVRRRRPDFEKLVIFLSDKLDWKCEYVVQKIIPLYTSEAFRFKQQSPSAWDPKIRFEKVIKKRIKQGIKCIEVAWTKLEEDCWTCENFYTTIEPENLVTKFMSLEDIENELTAIKAKDGGAMKKCKKRQDKNVTPPQNTSTSETVEDLAYSFSKTTISTGFKSAAKITHSEEAGGRIEKENEDDENSSPKPLRERVRKLLSAKQMLI